MQINSVLQMFEIEGEEIKTLSKTVNVDSFEKLVTLIRHSLGNIFITGCGTSAMAAKKIVHTLRVIDVPTFYLNPSDAVHGGLGAVQQNDVVIFISKGGSTKELTSFAPNLIKKKVQIIVITENVKSQLAKIANLVIKIKVGKELDKLNMLATTSTLAVISYFDVLAVTLMQEEKFSEENFLINHPAGAVGRRLQEDENEK